jgi:hypothetical protein
MCERVCVVAGAGAWPFYLATGAWVGQENRRFGDAPRLGFYSGRQVQGLAPRIGHVVGSVRLTPEEAATRTLSADPVERRVGEALAAALHDGSTAARVSVVLLSPPEDPETASFDPVPHEGDTAWTVFQRFTDIDRLRAATSTDELGSSER